MSETWEQQYFRLDQGMQSESADLDDRLTTIDRDDRAAIRAALARLESHAELVGALSALVEIINAAGLINLSNGVQLGQTVWFVKASDRMKWAESALAQPPLQWEVK